MNINEFEKVVKELTEDRNKVAEGKREDYTKGDVDVLKNFKNQAEALGVTPETSLAVHMEKQFSAVLNYIKTDGESESEPIIKRIGDTINYLELLWGLINEEGVDINNTDKNIGELRISPNDLLTHKDKKVNDAIYTIIDVHKSDAHHWHRKTLVGRHLNLIDAEKHLPLYGESSYRGVVKFIDKDREVKFFKKVLLQRVG